MDPVSVLAITNASLGIARSLVHTVKELYELAEAYETAALGIRTVATQCDSFRIAIQRINKWLQKQNGQDDLDEDFWSALQGNIETGRLVLEDLEKRISGLKKNSAKFWTRTKYLWNGVIIGELQSQIQGLIAAMSILLQVIDIPSTGGKRSQSVAQKQRLNGLTVRNRNRAVELHERMQESQKQILTEVADPDQSVQKHLDTTQLVSFHASVRHEDPFVDEKRISDVSLQQQPLDDTAPPPYAYYPNDSKTPPATDLKNSALVDRKSQPKVSLETSPLPIGDKPKPKEPEDWSLNKKAKRPMWRTFMKRSSKQEPPRSLSDPVESTRIHNSPLGTPNVGDVEVISKKKETPATINSSPDQENYSELQQAMSGMPMPSCETESPKKNTSNNRSNNTGSNFASLDSLTTPSEVDVPAIKTPPAEKFASNNPYEQMRLEAQSSPERDVARKTRPDYQNQRSDSTDNFARIRPSQIVRKAREPSHSQEPAGKDNVESSPPPQMEPLSRHMSAGDRLDSIGSGSTSDDQQTWQTTTLNNRTLKFKVQFEKESFVNKISPSAARALGVDDMIEEFAGIPITHLTLLYTVSDGLSAEASTVLGDEAEFVVMDEYERRTPTLVLGAAFAHFARIAEEGQYVYWSPRSVPENVRNVERLRLYRRFELVRW